MQRDQTDMAAQNDSSTDPTPLPAYADDAAEVVRRFEKLAYDYSTVFWAKEMGHAVKVFRRLFAAQGVPMLPPADIVARQMRISEGTVRMVYEGIRAVSKAGGVLPALAERQAQLEAAEAAEAALPKQRPIVTALQTAPAAPAIAQPIARRPLSTAVTSAKTTGSGFLG